MSETTSGVRPAIDYEYNLIVAQRDVEVAHDELIKAKGDLARMQASPYFKPDDVASAASRVERRQSECEVAERTLMRIQTNQCLRSL